MPCRPGRRLEAGEEPIAPREPAAAVALEALAPVAGREDVREEVIDLLEGEVGRGGEQRLLRRWEGTTRRPSAGKPARRRTGRLCEGRRRKRHQRPSPLTCAGASASERFAAARASWPLVAASHTI